MTTTIERPILFNGAMVRAILEGRKTQTRRVVADKHMPLVFAAALPALHESCPYGQPGDRLWVRETWRTAKLLDSKSPAAIGEMCTEAGYTNPWAPLAYEADGYQNSEWRGFDLGGDAEPGKTRVSIHMPRWASRILLEITAVRVERLQDISEADARAEGIAAFDVAFAGDKRRDPLTQQHPTVRFADAFCDLWQSINGEQSWHENPWVWVVEFKRVQP